MTFLDGGAAVGESAECEGPGPHSISLPQEEAALRISSGQVGVSPLTCSPTARLFLTYEPSGDQTSLHDAIA